MAEDEDGDLLQFLEQLAGNPPSLASGPCTQSGAISCLDAFVPNLTSQSSIRPPPSYRDIREVPTHAQLFATARSVRTPEQVLQQLFQQTSRPQMQPLPPHPKRTCVATPLYLRRRMDYEALPGTLVPIQEAIFQHEEDSASLQRLPMGQPCPEGEASSSTWTMTLKHEFSPPQDSSTPRSNESEPPVRPRKKPRRKTDLWRINNQEAQKRFRQKQKDKQRAQEELALELSEKVADLEHRQRSLRASLEAYQQAERRRSAREEALLKLDFLKIRLTRQQVLDMDLNALYLMWKVIGQTFGACLAEAEQCPFDPLLQHLQALGLEVLQLLQCLLKHNPGLINAFTTSSIQGVEGSAALDGAIWRGALERLELTQHQREALQGVRKAVLEVLSGLLPQRTELTTQLQGALGETCICTQAQIVHQLHANMEAAFVHRLTLNLLAQI